jgi:UDP-N-acetylglucosamine:LPS N-acetylglucosamine transferase
MRILFVLGSGGHTRRGIVLSEQIKAEKYFVVPWESKLTKRKVGHNYFSVISPRYQARSNTLLSVIRTVFLFLHGLVLLFVIRPAVAISTGSGLTYPIFMMAKMIGIKTIFIETPSRVYKPSIAGRLLLGKVDLWLASWPELAERCKGIEYMGMIA